jgi:Bacteriophage HK97-gp10, putative tail-component
MSKAFEFHINGLKELDHRLRELPERVMKKTVRSVMREVGNWMRDQIVANAPEETGFLKEHFGVRVSYIKKDLMVSAFIGPKTDKYPKSSGARDDKS